MQLYAENTLTEKCAMFNAPISLSCSQFCYTAAFCIDEV